MKRMGKLKLRTRYSNDMVLGAVNQLSNIDTAKSSSLDLGAGRYMCIYTSYMDRHGSLLVLEYMYLYSHEMLPYWQGQTIPSDQQEEEGGGVRKRQVNDKKQ